jgi:hypothetical protein
VPGDETESHEQYPFETWHATPIKPVALAVHDWTAASRVGLQVFPLA